MTPASPTSTSRRDERRRQQDRLSTRHVLDAAEEVMAEKGYAGATVREVAEAAELSVGVLYNLFPGGKAEIFAAVVGRRTEQLVDMLDEARGRQGSPRRRLHAVIDVVLAYYDEHATYYRLFQRAIGGDWLKFEATASESNWQHYRSILDRFAELFRDGAMAGELRDDDPAAMAVMLAGILQAYLAHRLVGLAPHGVSGGDEVSGSDAFPPQDLHALVDRAFARDAPKQPEVPR